MKTKEIVEKDNEITVSMPLCIDTEEGQFRLENLQRFRQDDFAEFGVLFRFKKTILITPDSLFALGNPSKLIEHHCKMLLREATPQINIPELQQATELATLKEVLNEVDKEEYYAYEKYDFDTHMFSLWIESKIKELEK